MKETTVQTTKPTTALKTPITVVSLYVSRIEKIPKEESTRAKTRKKKRACRLMYTYVIR